MTELTPVRMTRLTPGPGHAKRRRWLARIAARASSHIAARASSRVASRVAWLVLACCLVSAATAATHPSPSAALSAASSDDKTAPRDVRDPQRLLVAGYADAAIGALQQQLQRDPNDARAWNLLSRAYMSEQQMDSAISAGEKAVALNPDSAEYHLWLGRAYGQKAEHSIFINAIRCAKRVHAEFMRAVSLQQNNLSAQSDLAEFLLEAPGFLGGGPDKAQQAQQKLAQLDPASGHWMQARIAEKEKRYADAEREYHAAIAAAGNKGSYWMNLASYYRRRNQLDDMERATEEGVRTHRGPDGTLLYAAELLVGTGRNYPVAEQWLRQYFAADESAEGAPAFEAHYLLGSLKEKQGDRATAAAEYRAALELASNYAPAQEALKKLGR